MAVQASLNLHIVIRQHRVGLALVKLEVYLWLVDYELPLVNTEALHQTAQPTTTDQPAGTLCSVCVKTPEI